MGQKKSLSLSYEKAAFWVGVLSLIVTVVLIYLTLQSDWSLAARSGAFRRPVTALGLGSLRLEPGAETQIVFGAPRISRGKAVVIAALPFVLSNAGDETLDSPSVMFRLPNLFGRDKLEQLDFSPVGNVQATELKRSITKTGQWLFSSYVLSAVNPGQSVGLNEPFYLPDTVVHSTVTANTKDNVPATMDVTVKLAFTFQVSVSAKDTAAADYNFSIRTTEATSLDDLQRKVVVTDVQRRLDEARRDVTVGQYLRALVFGAPDEEVYLVFAELDEHSTPDGPLFFAKPEPRIRLISYSPVSWRRLLRR